MNTRLDDLKIKEAEYLKLLEIATKFEKARATSRCEHSKKAFAHFAEILVDAGFPNCSVTVHTGLSRENSAVVKFILDDSAYFRFDVGFYNGQISLLSVSSTNICNDLEAIERYSGYYETVHKVLKMIDEKNPGLQQFFDEIDSFDELEGFEDKCEFDSYDVHRDLNKVREEIEHEEIGLSAGNVVLYNDEPPYRTKWNKRTSFWKKATVVKVTEKTVTLRLHYPTTDGSVVIQEEATKKLDWGKFKKVESNDHLLYI